MLDSSLQKQVDRLSDHGKTVWAELETSYTMDAATTILALQVCRTVDRLDRLDAALKNKSTWLRIANEADLGEGAIKIVIEIDAVLSEARQQSLALSALLHKLGVGKLEEAIAKGSGFRATYDEIRGL